MRSMTKDSLEDCDLITTSIPLSLARKSHILLTEQARNSTRNCSTGSSASGFKLDFGEDGTGWQFKYLSRGGGYYFNVGCSDLIVKGEVGLVQFSDIAEFVAEGARMRSGDTLGADLIVLATGYKGQEHLVSKLFGADVATRVGPIWGFGDDQELRNMFMRTAQPGLWFIAGSFAQCRIYSKYLALADKGLRGGPATPSWRLSGRPGDARLAEYQQPNRAGRSDRLDKIRAHREARRAYEVVAIGFER